MDFQLRNINEIEDTCWIELNISGTDMNFKHWQENSKYLDEFSYNLFADIFEDYADDFNYYGPTKFDKIQLEKIIQKIQIRIVEFEKATNINEIIEISKKTTNALNLKEDLLEHYINRQNQLSLLILDIKNLANEIIEFLKKCIIENEVLWILGL